MMRATAGQKTLLAEQRHTRLLTIAFVWTCIAPAVAQTAATQPVRAIRAAAYVNPAGEIVRGDVVLRVEGERIAGLGAASSDVPLDDYPGAVLCPGLIDCDTKLGATTFLSERQKAVQPDLHAADALNRYSPQLRAALAAGVTTFALTPADDNLVGGRIGVAQTSGPDFRPRLLTADGPLKLSLSTEVLKVDREPTSRTGAIGMLRDLLSVARDGKGTTGTAAQATAGTPDEITAFAAGRLPGMFTAPRGADVLAALELAQSFNLKLALLHSADARDIADQLAGRVTAAVVGPIILSDGPRPALATALYHRRGVPVVITGGLPETPPDTLRTGAALATRAGLDLATARRAITAIPAEVLGVADRIGALAEGRQADVVVFSGDPLDLRARVLAVYIAGQRVYDAALVRNGDQP
jgi:imidazolonepropionase-like amidohydrolase